MGQPAFEGLLDSARSGMWESSHGMPAGSALVTFPRSSGESRSEQPLLPRKPVRVHDIGWTVRMAPLLDRGWPVRVEVGDH